MDGVIKVNYILRFENIEEEFENFCRKESINASLPHAHINGKKQEIAYTDFYDDDTTEIIYNIFKNDFSLLNYNKDINNT